MSSLEQRATSDSAAGPPRADRPARPEIAPAVAGERCAGCGRCVAVCTAGALQLVTAGWSKTAVVADSSRCTGCLACVPACLLEALTFTARPKPRLAHFLARARWLPKRRWQRGRWR